MAKTIHWYECRAKEKPKHDFEEDFIKLMNNAVFGISIVNVKKTKRYQAWNNWSKHQNQIIMKSIFYSENLLALEMKIKLMNKPVYLGLSILELYKIVMHKFWYDYVKPKYEEEAKLCFMDTDCFIVYIKSEVIYIKIAKGVETRFDTLFDLNYGLERPLPQGKNKEVIRLLKGELGRKIIT